MPLTQKQNTKSFQDLEQYLLMCLFICAHLSLNFSKAVPPDLHQNKGF